MKQAQKNLRPIVVFDLDGTLADTAPDLLDSLNHALINSGYAPQKVDDMSVLVGQGGRQMIERALRLQNIEPTPPLVEPILALFFEHYSASMPGKTQYFSEADAVLDDLQAQGLVLAVCTNKSQKMAERLLGFLEPKRRFAAICGGDLFAWRKPDPRHILATIERAGGDANRAVMVGDSFADIEAAKQVSIPVIGVDFGYSDVPVCALEPDYVVGDFLAIGQICKHLLCRE